MFPRRPSEQIPRSHRYSKFIPGVIAGMAAMGVFWGLSGGHAQPMPGYGPKAPTATSLKQHPRLENIEPATPQRISLNDTPRDDQHESTDTPGSVRQGEVLKVHLRAGGESIPVRAYLAGHAARFFAEEGDHDYVALVPVSVFEKPGQAPLTVEDNQQKVTTLKQIQILDGRYRTQNVNVSAQTEGLQPLPGEMEAIQRLKNLLTPIRYWQEPFLTPTTDCQNSPFGVKRYHNGKATGDYHKGVDLRSPLGRPVRATAAGIVKIATMYRLHGGTVGLDHGQGISSIYIHMSKVKAKVGDHVLKGDTIGYVGSTGFATGPHLHWGLYVSGLPVNPNPWLDPVPVCR